MPSSVYNRGKFLLGSGTVSWASATDLHLLLLQTITGGFNADHNFVSEAVDGTNNVEVTTVGYARKQLASKTATEDDANDRLNLDAADITWTAVGDGAQTARIAVVYRRVGADDSTPADDDVIAWIDFTDTVLNGGDFVLQIADLLRLT